MGVLPWDLAAMTLQEGSLLKTEIVKNEARPDSRNFPLDKVLTEHAMFCEVEGDYLLLSQQDYLNEFGATHRSKDPKVPEIWIYNQLGHAERCWLFKAEKAYRRLKIASRVADLRHSEILSPTDHLHREQGCLMMGSVAGTRLSESSLQELLGKNPCISTISEYHNTLGRKRGPPTSKSMVMQVWHPHSSMAMSLT